MYVIPSKASSVTVQLSARLVFSSATIAVIMLESPAVADCLSAFKAYMISPELASITIADSARGTGNSAFFGSAVASGEAVGFAEAFGEAEADGVLVAFGEAEAVTFGDAEGVGDADGTAETVAFTVKIIADISDNMFFFIRIPFCPNVVEPYRGAGGNGIKNSVYNNYT